MHKPTTNSHTHSDAHTHATFTPQHPYIPLFSPFPPFSLLPCHIPPSPFPSPSTPPPTLSIIRLKVISIINYITIAFQNFPSGELNVHYQANQLERQNQSESLKGGII